MNPLKTMPRTYSLSWSLATLLILAASPCRGQQPQTPSALEKAVTISYYPSLRKLAVRVADAAAVGTAKEAGVEVRRTDDARPVARGKLPLSAKGGQVVLDLPALANGAYEVHLSLLGGGPTVVKRFKQRNYPWLGNELGKNNAVYPPFQPVKVRGHTAEVVLRTYILNGFGLWCSVKSQGKEILARRSACGSRRGPESKAGNLPPGIGPPASHAGPFTRAQPRPRRWRSARHRRWNTTGA